MIGAILARSSAALGRPLSRLALAAAVLGAAAFAAGLALGFAPHALAALDASFLFLAGLAAGGIAFSAALRLGHSRWAEEVVPIADASAGFFWPALAALALVLAGARTFIPWAATGPNAASLAPLALREIALTFLLFIVGQRYAARSRTTALSDSSIRRAATIYLLLYVATLSLWIADLVMGLGDFEPSTVLPAYYWLGAFLSAIAWVALVASARGRPGPNARHDLGKLIFALIMVWSYLLWSAFLPVWYGNIPNETAQLLARWDGRWKILTLAVLTAVFVWPFWLLFPEATKRGRLPLGIGAGLVLAGMMGERILLVIPPLDLPGGAAPIAVGSGVMLGMSGLFVLAVGARLGTGPPSPNGGGKQAAIRPFPD